MDRKETIKRCKGIIRRLEHTAYGEQNLEAIKDIEALDEVISALEKQEQDRWISVTEKPPKEDGRYLITEKTDGVKVQEGYFCRTRDDEPYWGYLHVTAWRPLPEPYTEEES